MLRSVAFEGVVLQVPSNVEVGVESGELTLSFSNFSGDVSVRPKKRKSPDEQETEQGGKRIALSQAAGSDFVFPNGGRSPFKNGGQGGSQASSSAGDAPEPRALAWDELRDTTSPNGGQPEPGAGSGFSPNGGQPEPGGSGSAPAAASDEPCGSQHPAAAAAASAASAAAFDAAKTDDEDDDDDDAPAGGGVGERLGEATQVGHEATQVGANTLANAVSAATSGPSSPAAERSAAAAAEAAPFAFAEGEWATAAVWRGSSTHSSCSGVTSSSSYSHRRGRRSPPSTISTPASASSARPAPTARPRCRRPPPPRTTARRAARRR